jgi:hypothetical protein
MARFVAHWRRAHYCVHTRVRQEEGGRGAEKHGFYRAIPRAHLGEGLLLLTPEAASQLLQPMPLGTRGPPWRGVLVLRRRD